MGPQVRPPLRSVIRRDTLDSFDKVPREKYWVGLSGIMSKKGFLRKIVKIGVGAILTLFVDVFLLMFWFHVGFKPLVPGTMLRFVDLNFWQPLKP